MNFCIKCGNKLQKNEKFCTKCGNKIVTETDKKLKQDKKNQNIILLLGIFLVLFSTFALGIISWKNMESILRIAFFSFECILFFGLSYVIKKLTDSKIYRFFFVVGLILIPYTLSLIPYYEFLINYFNRGAGLYIYLAIIYLLITVLYFIINKKFDSRVVDLLSLLTLFMSFVFTGFIFNDRLSVITLLISIYILVLYSLSLSNIFKDNFKKIMKIFSYVIYSALFIILFLSLIINDLLVDSVLNIISFIIYSSIGYIFIYKKEKNAFSVITPLFNFTLLCAFTFSTLNSFIAMFNSTSNNDIVIVFALSVISYIYYFISILMKNKLFNYVSLGVTYFTQIVAMTSGLIIPSYGLLIVITSLLLLFNIFNIFIQKRSWINYLIPINIFFILESILKMTFNFEFIYVLLSTALIFIIIYVILKTYKSKYAMTYLATSYALCMISMYNFLKGFDIINFGIVAILLIIFVFSYIFKESIGISIVSFISLNISSLLMYEGVEHSIYYGLLTISGLTLIFSLLINKLKKIDLKQYILYSEIVIFIITLFNSLNLPSYILFINIFIYALSYMALIKFHNYKWWRLAYIMLGLLTIIRIIYTLINPIVIASIISILVILIILTIMYLLEIEKNLALALISLIILYPYYMLIGNTFADLTQLYLIPALIYTFIFTEIINFKDPDTKKAFTIIPITIISYWFVMTGEGVSSIVINVCVSLAYIILGLYRKYNYLLYFGVIFIVATLIIKLFTILNSMAVVILLIIIGFILIGISLFVEFKKKK